MTTDTRTELATLLRQHAQGLLTDHEFIKAVGDLTFREKRPTEPVVSYPPTLH